ncbi:hypothetical protein LIX31_06450 [Leptospira kirschneri]|nr:hypothetical protein [Leptospira kirschneri]WBF95583.1 hypothetical protein LIX31_06450 [Leptospira kirschneri]
MDNTGMRHCLIRSSNFFQIEVSGKNLKLISGVIGTDGNAVFQTYFSEAKCMEVAQKIIKEKVNTGYVETSELLVKSPKEIILGFAAEHNVILSDEDSFGKVAAEALEQFGPHHYHCNTDKILKLKGFVGMEKYSQLVFRLISHGVESIFKRKSIPTDNDRAISSAAVVLAFLPRPKTHISELLLTWYLKIRDQRKRLWEAKGNIALALAAQDYAAAAPVLAENSNFNPESSVIWHRNYYALCILRKDPSDPIAHLEAAIQSGIKFTWGHAYLAAILADLEAFSALPVLHLCCTACKRSDIKDALLESVRRLETRHPSSKKDERMVWLLGTVITKDIQAGTGTDNVFFGNFRSERYAEDEY